MRGRVVIAILICASLYGFYNYYVAPEQFPISFMRGTVRQVDATIFLGPYPTEQELARLRRMGVTMVISLLDPAMPFETPLIDQEKIVVERHGMQFDNVPFSIFPALDTPENVAKATNLAARVRSEPGVYYIHCYLGRHRTGFIEKIIDRVDRQAAAEARPTALPAD